MESGPSFNVVLGERGTCRLSFRNVVGERGRDIGSLVGRGSEGGGGGLSEIIAAHRESTSIVEVAAEARGFFSTFLS